MKTKIIRYTNLLNRIIEPPRPRLFGVENEKALQSSAISAKVLNKHVLMSAPRSELYIYSVSGVRCSGHRVKPNMAANGGPNLCQSQSLYAVFHV